jgi:hypothetical protein
VVEFFEQVAALFGVNGERRWVVFVQALEQFADGVLNGLVPSEEISSEKVTLKQIRQPISAEDAAFLQLPEASV